MRGDGLPGVWRRELHQDAILERARIWAPYLKKMKGMGSIATEMKAKRAPDQK